MVAVNALVDPIDNPQAREAMQSVFLQPVRESWRAVVADATNGLEQQWQAQVYNAYQQNIESKFPFSISSSDDAAMSDVTDFFQPKNGTLWTFINTYLGPYLYADATGWHAQTWLGVGAGFAPEFLTALAQAKQLSDGLFKAGGGQPGFNFELYPEPTPGLSQIILLVNGQSYRYVNGPQQWQTLSWPGTQMGQDSALTAIAASGLSPNTLEAQGPWGLFHLLSQSQLTAEPGAAYRATWNMQSNDHDYTVSLLVRGDDEDNVFQQLLINKFNLPASLFDAQPIS